MREPNWDGIPARDGCWDSTEGAVKAGDGAPPLYSVVKQRARRSTAGLPVGRPRGGVMGSGSGRRRRCGTMRGTWIRQQRKLRVE